MKESLDYLKRILRIFGGKKNKIFNKLEHCASFFMKAVNSRFMIIESIEVSDNIFKRAALNLIVKYSKLLKGLEEKKYEKIKVYKQMFPVSKGALLAKMFYHFTLGNFPGIISTPKIDSKGKRPDDREQRLIGNASLFVILCMLLSEFWKTDAKKEELEEICMLVISNQSREENLVAIFKLLLKEI